MLAGLGTVSWCVTLLSEQAVISPASKQKKKKGKRLMVSIFYPITLMLYRSLRQANSIAVELKRVWCKQSELYSNKPHLMEPQGIIDWIKARHKVLVASVKSYFCAMWKKKRLGILLGLVWKLYKVSDGCAARMAIDDGEVVGYPLAELLRCKPCRGNVLRQW